MRKRPTTVAVLLLAATPSSALAQGDGVTIDPDSPSGREYAIPLEDARRDAGSAGRGGKVRRGERTAPLFGEGIEPSAQSAQGGSPGGVTGEGDSPADAEGGDGDRSGQGGGGAGDGDDTGPSSGETSREREGGLPGKAAAVSRSAATPAAGSSDALIVGVVGLGVLALGAFAGVLVRRRAS